MAAEKGWIFCLNSSDDSESGSRWGFVQTLLDEIGLEKKKGKRNILFKRDVYGRPCRKDLRLGKGDAVVFYHGKKARRAEWDRGPVRPYQLTMVGYIEDVDQDESGEVTYLELRIPNKIYKHFKAEPLKLDDKRILKIVRSTGLGGGATGAFFPIEPVNWKKLIKFFPA